MTLPRSVPNSAAFADLRNCYPGLLDLLRPYGERLMCVPRLFTPPEGNVCPFGTKAGADLANYSDFEV
jgi:hypothetical protein